ncbi:MAG: tetratricopeptide repeat protein [Candidatus Methylomirabilia bacterium]
MRWLVALCLVVALPSRALGAAALLPAAPPALALGPLIPLVGLPLEKPPVVFPKMAFPLSPGPDAGELPELPPLPPAPASANLPGRPLAPLPAQSLFACNPLGTLLAVASQLFACGRVRFEEGSLAEARDLLERAAQRADGRLKQETRYLLGETYARLNQLEAAERNFLMATQQAPHSELGLYALSSLGWLAFQLDDPARALASFEELIKAGPAPAVVPYASHGRALALYALGRYGEAREAWEKLANTSLPLELVRTVTFWLGESLGRAGEYERAQGPLRRFVNTGRHPLLKSGLLRLGEWALAGGHPDASAQAFRQLLSEFPNGAEVGRARVGLARAHLALDDLSGARKAVRQLQHDDPSHPLLLPALFLVLRRVLEREAIEYIPPLSHDLLALDLPAGLRSYVLYLNGEASRRLGLPGQARSQLEQVSLREPAGLLGWRATLALAQIDFKAREFTRALREVQRLLNQSLTPEILGVALLIQGEAAYRTKKYETAARAFRRFLAELPGHPQTADATLSLAWSEFRLERREEARKRWLAYARRFPEERHAGAALLLAAEMAGQTGKFAAVRDLLEEMLSRYPTDPHAAVARLNRAILDIRSGQLSLGLAEMETLKGGEGFFAAVGRARLARGAALLAASPAKAAVEFRQAIVEGEGALAHLGLASALLALGDRAEAGRQFAEARDLGTEPVRRLAEYGIAAAAFPERSGEALTRTAAALVRSPSASVSVPGLLYLLMALATEETRWDEARRWTLRLIGEFPGHEAAADALVRLGAGAYRAQEWQLVRESYQLLLARYAKSPHIDGVRVSLGEALFKTGAPAKASEVLREFVDSTRNDPRLPDALALLARASEAAGDRPAAIQALARLVREHPDSPHAVPARMSQARLFQEGGRWEESRKVLEEVVNVAEPGIAAEAAFKLGEGLNARGDHKKAVEFYMSAAYLSPDTGWGQRALAGAGRSFVALNKAEAAKIVYRKLLAHPAVQPELARRAKEALAQLGESRKAEAD